MSKKNNKQSRKDQNAQPKATNNRNNGFAPSPQNANVFKTKIKSRVDLIPRTVTQEDYINKMMDMDNTIVFALGPAGCVDMDTEYLTPKGWKRISEYEEGDEVAQVTEEGACAVFVKPLDYIKQPSKGFYHFLTNDTDQMLSANHDVAYFDDIGMLQKIKVSTLVESGETSFIVPLSPINSLYIENPSITVDTIDVEELVATMSDYFTGKWHGFKNLTDCDQSVAVMLITYFVNMHGNTVTIGDLDEVEGLQRVALAAGLNSYYSKVEDGYQIILGINFKADLLENKIPTLQESPDGFEYCFTVPSGYLLLRRNGRIFVTGNCGKTLLATLYAIKGLKEGVYDKIVVTRPAVSTDEEYGFLPGTLVEKIAPWCRPVLDVFAEYFSQYEIDKMIEEGILELSPLGFMRGRTFKNSIILFDESQNSLPDTVKMALTRIGENSRMIVTGDVNQHDRAFSVDNGLKDIVSRVKSSGDSKGMALVEFENIDIKRHPIIEKVLNLYGQ